MQVLVREHVLERRCVARDRAVGQGAFEQLAAVKRRQAIQPGPHARRRPFVQPHRAVFCLRDGAELWSRENKH